jgi:hypothetical protein
MAPLVEAVAADHPSVRFERIDVSAEAATTRELGVMATPTLIGFAGDAEVARVIGRRERDEIEEFFAATGSGTPPPRASRTDVELRVGAGALVVTLGLLAGPSWPLLGFGAALGGYGLAGYRSRRR